MKTNTESLWLFALASKCQALSPQSIAFSLLLISLSWLAMALFYWAHPGGPAWGKTVKNIFTSKLSMIPGPKGLPLIGSMSLMTGLAHRKIAAMAETCNAKRLLAFSLGQTRLIVTCNPNVAREILNSSVFADRPVKESAYSLMFNRAIGFAPYGVYWRTLRRISAMHLFCPKQIKTSEAQRSEIASQMVATFAHVQNNLRVRDVLKRASLNNMMCSVFGRKYDLNDCVSEEVEELKSLVDEGYDLLGKLNWSDHLPCLVDFDLQRIRFRCSEVVPKVNRFVTRIISEHRDRTGGDKSSPDFVDVLLSLQGADKLSDSDMIAVLWEMIFRGTDTVAVLIEWILARLVLHPEIQSTVHAELDRVVGSSKTVDESHVNEMVYLTAVIKEVLRLHPPGPLLSWARLAITDTTIDGRYVPKGTTAMVNMWSIAKDPEVWADPMEFKPERFVAQNGEVEFSVFGSDLRLAPFGSGRRTCPGKALGFTTVTYWVASLLHEYEWLPSDKMTVDLSEVLRMSCEMAKPLTVNVRPRRKCTSQSSLMISKKINV